MMVFLIPAGQGNGRDRHQHQNDQKNADEFFHVKMVLHGKRDILRFRIALGRQAVKRDRAEGPLRTSIIYYASSQRYFFSIRKMGLPGPLSSPARPTAKGLFSSEI